MSFVGWGDLPRMCFPSISHSGEIPLADGTTMILVIFVVRRTSGTYDMFVVNKFFRPDGVSRTLMSKKDISQSEIEQTLVTTAKTFTRTPQSAKGPVIRWDELDLRRIDGKDEQIAAIKRWGKLRSVRVRTD